MIGFDSIDELFAKAHALSGAERDRFLATIRDETLKQKVRAFLDADGAAESSGFLAREPAHVGESLPESGDVLSGYRICEEIGRGGMGIVYLAEQCGTGKQVALKILNPLLWSSQDAQEQLAHEAKVSSRLDHASIVPLIELTEARGRTLLVHDYVQGVSLREESASFHREPPSKRWHSRSDIIREFLAMADALSHAHEQGVWHRDIKPSNILLEDGGPAQLVDFGLAKDSLDGTTTRSGFLKGSIPYMSPEQARARLRDVDHRSDLFSLGVVLFECLTGEHPFARRQDEELVEAIAHGTPRRLDECWTGAPKPLVAICHKALQHEPGDRYQSAAGFGSDLYAYLNDRDIQARLPRWYDLPARRLQRNRPTVIAIAALLGLLGVLLWLNLSHRTSAQIPIHIQSAQAATVFVQVFDAALQRYEPPRRFGTTPLSDKLPPGHYRFTFELNQVAFAELTRELNSESHDAIEVSIESVPDAAAPSDMIYIPAGPFIAGIGGPLPQYPRQEHTLDAFWIDEHEVTNEEYFAFIQATGHEAPHAWEAMDPQAYPTLPVIGVSWIDAVTYAEWQGKRLPTSLEWERAARSTDGRAYPWGDNPKDIASVRERACVGRVAVTTADRGFRVSDYCKNASSVGTNPTDLSPDGALDLLGNASEWVDGMPLTWVDGRSVPIAYHRIARGLHWSFSRPTADLSAIFAIPSTELSTNTHIGFRCAKSATSASTRPAVRGEES